MTIERGKGDTHGRSNRKSALAVAKMKPGKYCGGGGVCLQKKSENAGKRIFIFTVHGRK
ncbi:hypothetical protein [Brucella pituitosa]|uniref:hypothetical protein n=1 Tax=Brucella pituitosa TaxID=571256 RepID=UPI0013747101|nr:hypothetical protein [Brucella pituitosa]